MHSFFMLLRIFLLHDSRIWLHSGVALHAGTFCLIINSLFALIFQSASLQVPGLLWISIFFVIQLHLHYLFEDDFQNGSLEQFFLTSHKAGMIILCKIIAHWLLMSTVLIMPIIATVFILGPDKPAIYALVKIFPIITLLIICVSAFASAVTLGYSAGRMLIGVVSLPLVIPLFILGSSQIANQEIYLFCVLCLLLPVLILGISFSLKLIASES